MPNPRPPLPEPISIGRFRVQRILDRGPYDLLCLAEDKESQALVALKVPAPGVKTPGLAGRYQRVWETTRELKHPGVHRVLELGQDAEAGPYLVMDYLEGASLASLLAGSLPAFPALHLLIQLVHVMEATARAGVLHGDLQPHNIWVTPQGDVRLQSLGTYGAPMPGSEGYTAPERLDGGTPSARADQFSFAAIAFHLLAGKPAFPGSTPKDVAQAVRNGELLIPSKMPLMMQKVFLKAMDKEPEARYASLRDFMAVLIAAAPLEEDRLDDLLSFLDGKPLAFEGHELLSRHEAPGSDVPLDPQFIRSLAESQATTAEGKDRLERRLLDTPGVLGFAAFNEGGTLLTCSPHAGELADLAPSVYFHLADSIFGDEGGSGIRHFLFRTKPGIRYLLHRGTDTQIVIKLKPDANLQEILRGLDHGLNLN